MSFHLLSHALASAFTWTWTTSLSATVLIALVLLIQVAFGKVLAPRWRYLLGLLMVLRFLLPAAPASPLSIFNLGNHRTAPLPVHVEAQPAFVPSFVPRAVSTAPAIAFAAPIVKSASPRAHGNVSPASWRGL